MSTVVTTTADPKIASQQHLVVLLLPEEAGVDAGVDVAGDVVVLDVRAGIGRRDRSGRGAPVERERRDTDRRDTDRHGDDSLPNTSTHDLSLMIVPIGISEDACPSLESGGTQVRFRLADRSAT
jgi:hypothetical protein